MGLARLQTTAIATKARLVTGRVWAPNEAFVYDLSEILRSVRSSFGVVWLGVAGNNPVTLI